MSSSRIDRLAADFWQFSVERYEQPAMKQTCLTLQDKYGLSVNMLLFCLWQGEQRQVLTAEFFANDIAAFERMNREVLIPFRQQRRSDKQQNAAWLRSTVLKVELDLERQLQRELINAVATSRHVQRATQAAPALISLGNYLRHQGLALDEALLGEIKMLLSKAE
ncbi:MAG: TIGR02444 family protein [Gammaproteobacteria bacterium]|nr:TIGR02444 family protein [Gammaproteobacteria bacterium]